MVTSMRRCRCATWAVLALVGLTGCAVFRSAKTPPAAAQELAPPAPTPAPVAETPPPAPPAPDPRVADLERTIEALRADLTELRSELDATRRVAAHQMEVAELRTRLDAMRHAGALPAESTASKAQQEALPKRLAAAEARIEALTASVRNVEASVGALTTQASRGETSAPYPNPAARQDAKERRARPLATPSALPPQALFDRGLESFRQGDFGQAVVTFEELLLRHPSHTLAAPARFWIGEAYFRSRDYRHAAVEYQKAVTLAHRGEKTPEALYKLGLTYRALKRPDRARETWSQLIREFPQSPPAERAREALRELPRTAKSAVPENRPTDNRPL